MELSFIIISEMRGFSSFTHTLGPPGKGFQQNSNTMYSTTENNVVPSNSILRNIWYAQRIIHNTKK